MAYDQNRAIAVLVQPEQSYSPLGNYKKEERKTSNLSGFTEIEQTISIKQELPALQGRHIDSKFVSDDACLKWYGKLFNNTASL